MNAKWRVVAWRIARRMETIDYALVGSRLVIMTTENTGRYARVHAEDHGSVLAAAAEGSRDMGGMEERGAVLIVAPVALSIDTAGYEALMALPNGRWQNLEADARVSTVIRRVIEQGARV